MSQTKEKQSFPNEVITILPISVWWAQKGSRGGGGNLGVILVRVCEPVFQNLPNSYT